MTDFLHEKYHEAVSRQNTFLLAATGSAIAFALHETSDWNWSWSLAPVSLALLAWAGGFVAGIFNGHAKQRALRANMAMNLAEQSGDPEKRLIAQKMFERANTKAQATYQIQLWSLLAGAILFVGGQGLRLWEQDKTGRESGSECSPTLGRPCITNGQSTNGVR